MTDKRYDIEPVEVARERLKKITIDEFFEKKHINSNVDKWELRLESDPHCKELLKKADSMSKEELVSCLLAFIEKCLDQDNEIGALRASNESYKKAIELKNSGEVDVTSGTDEMQFKIG